VGGFFKWVIIMVKHINSGFSEVIKDKTAFTSEQYVMASSNPLWVGVTGAGPVYIEVKGTDDVWRTYPELTFSGTTAQLVTVKKGLVRFRFAASAATTLEFSA